MSWSQALLLFLMVASAGCSSGATGPLHWTDAPPKSRALTADQADLRQQAAAQVALDPLCDKYRLFDAKKTRANCDTLINSLLAYTLSLLSGAGGGTSVNVINVVNTLVVQQLEVTFMDTLASTAKLLEDVFTNNATWAGAGSRLMVQSVVPGVADLELDASQLNQVVSRVGEIVKVGLVAGLAASAGRNVWEEEPFPKSINVRIFSDLTFDNNTNSTERAAILAAARATAVNGTDQLAVSLREALGEAAGAECDAVFEAALEAGGAITSAVCNGTAGAGGAVSKVTLSNAEAALSEVIGALNGTIIAALADPASALSAAVLARAAEELETAGSDLASAAGDAASGAILSGISKGGGGAAQGPVLQALSNGTSALSAALAKLLSTDISNAASALRAALSSLVDSRAAAAVSGDGALTVGRLNNASSHLSTALEAHISGLAGPSATLAGRAQRLAAAITNASGVVPSELSRSGSPIRSAVEAAAAPKAAAAVAGALLAGGGITVALGDANASASKSVAGAVEFSLDNPSAAVTQAADAAITADVLAALKSNGSAVSEPVDAAAVKAASAIGTLNATVQSAVQTELQALRLQTALCGKALNPFSITQAAPAVTLTGASNFVFTLLEVNASCAASAYLAHGVCTLQGPSGAAWDYILNGEEVDYTTNKVTCKAGPVSVFAGTNTNGDTYMLTARALCCPFDQSGPI